MPQDTYTKSEIDLKFDKVSSDINHGFEKVDLKFEQVDQKFEQVRKEMQDGFDKVDLKFERLEQKLDSSVKYMLSETRNMFLEQQVKEKAEREQERKTTTRWLIGIAISLAGLAVSIIVNFFLRK